MKTAEEIALEYGLCNCDEAYKYRNLEAPDCHWHSTSLEEAMKAYANQKLDEVLEIINGTDHEIKENVLDKSGIVEEILSIKIEII